MSIAVQQLLAAFSALPETEQHQAAVEILRRMSPPPGDISEAGLVEAAELLFLALDKEEAGHAKR